MGKFGHDNVADWGTGELSITSGAGYTALPDQISTFVTLQNTSSAILVMRKKDSGDTPFELPVGVIFSFPTKMTLSDIEIKRKDNSATAATLSYYWGL